MNPGGRTRGNREGVWIAPHEGMPTCLISVSALWEARPVRGEFNVSEPTRQTLESLLSEAVRGSAFTTNEGGGISSAESQETVHFKVPWQMPPREEDTQRTLSAISKRLKGLFKATPRTDWTWLRRSSARLGEDACRYFAYPLNWLVLDPIVHGGRNNLWGEILAGSLF